MSDNMWLAGQVYLQEQNNKELRRVREVNEQMLRHTVQANQQIVKMQQHIAQAQHLSNKIQTEQLKVQLRDEEAKAEQKILRNLVFSCENVADALDTLSPASLYAAAEQDMQQFLDLIEMAQERLDSIDDKRAAKEQYKRLLSIQAKGNQYADQYATSLLKALRGLGSAVVQKETEREEPPVAPQKEVKYLPSRPIDMSLLGVFVVPPLALLLDVTIFGLPIETQNYQFPIPIITGILLVLLSVKAYQQQQEKKRFPERVAEAQEEINKAEAAYQEEMKIYQRKLNEHNAKEESFRQLQYEYEQTLDKALIEHADYFNFLNLLKKVDPSKLTAV